MRNRIEFRNANAQARKQFRCTRVLVFIYARAKPIKALSLSLFEVAKVAAGGRYSRKKQERLIQERVYIYMAACRAKRAEHFSCFRHKIRARSGALILQPGIEDLFSGRPDCGKTVHKFRCTYREASLRRIESLPGYLGQSVKDEARMNGRKW